MQAWAPELVAALAATILASCLGVGAWVGRRFIASLDALRLDVQRLREQVHADAIIDPVFRAKQEELLEVATEHTAQIAVLREWKRDHDRWHERQARA